MAPVRVLEDNQILIDASTVILPLTPPTVVASFLVDVAGAVVVGELICGNSPDFVPNPGPFSLPLTVSENPYVATFSLSGDSSGVAYSDIVVKPA